MSDKTTVVPTGSGEAVVILDSDTRYALKTLLWFVVGDGQLAANHLMNADELVALMKLMNELPSGD